MEIEMSSFPLSGEAFLIVPLLWKTSYNSLAFSKYNIHLLVEWNRFGLLVILFYCLLLEKKFIIQNKKLDWSDCG